MHPEVLYDWRERNQKRLDPEDRISLFTMDWWVGARGTKPEISARLSDSCSNVHGNDLGKILGDVGTVFEPIRAILEKMFRKIMGTSSFSKCSKCLSSA